jgi:hypothetical protein
MDSTSLLDLSSIGSWPPLLKRVKQAIAGWDQGKPHPVLVLAHGLNV